MRKYWELRAVCCDVVSVQCGVRFVLYAASCVLCALLRAMCDVRRVLYAVSCVLCAV